MVRVADHLSAAELRAGYRGSKDATRARHYQVIWLLARGRAVAETARLTGFVPRWVEELVVRYNRFGPSSLGGRRRDNGAKHNGAKPTVLPPEILDVLRERVKRPPDDGGVWSSRKVAAVMAAEPGLAKVAEQRGGAGAARDRLDDPEAAAAAAPCPGRDARRAGGVQTYGPPRLQVVREVGG